LPFTETFFKKIQKTYNFGIILTTGLAQKLGSGEVEGNGWCLFSMGEKGQNPKVSDKEAIR
jgi:hypothetical protein